MSPELSVPVSLPELEELARERIPHAAYEFIACGAGDGVTARWNTEAWNRIAIRPRVLVDVARPDTRVTLFGRTHPAPILLAPTAYHRALHAEGELATARGAGAAGAAWVVSTGTNTEIEAIAREAAAPLWFQLYVQEDRGFTRELVRRVEDAGCEVLCLTVDTPVLGARNRQHRSGFRLPDGVTVPYYADVLAGRRALDTPAKTVLTWADVDWLLATARVPVVLKGILTAEDAERAIAAGVAGIVVSNHGGRNLDTLPPTAEALPEVVRQVAGRVPVLVDGGIRRGTDVLKALAMGASATLIGRPYLYGLALEGAEGVRRSVEILRHELELAMALAGRSSLAGLDPGALWRSPSPVPDEPTRADPGSPLTQEPHVRPQAFPP